MFEAEFTDEDLEQIEDKEKNDVAIKRRMGLAVLTKNCTELEQLAKDDPETSLFMVESIADGIESYKYLVEILEAAKNRMGYALRKNYEIKEELS